MQVVLLGGGEDSYTVGKESVFIFVASSVKLQCYLDAWGGDEPFRAEKYHLLKTSLKSTDGVAG